MTALQIYGCENNAMFLITMATIHELYDVEGKRISLEVSKSLVTELENNNKFFTVYTDEPQKYISKLKRLGILVRFGRKERLTDILNNLK